MKQAQQPEMKEQKKIGINFGIKEIKTIRFSLNDIPETETVKNENVQFQILPASFFNYEENLIGFDIVLTAYIKGKQNKSVCELITRISFVINNLKEIVPEENKNTPNLPDHFMQTLLSISLSTTRGVLFAKTEGSVLNKYYLPILNPANFKPTGIVPNPKNKQEKL